jgi:hypothetical protein
MSLNLKIRLYFILLFPIVTGVKVNNNESCIAGIVHSDKKVGNF